MADRDEPFLDRWSRRKRRGGATPVVEAEPDTPPLAPATGADQSGRENAVAVVADDEPPTDETPADVKSADLPDIASLDKDSDYTGFLRDGVPEHLTRKALHKLWRSDPAFGFLDGLNDYDEDFSLAFSDAVTKTIKTAYKVGKGFVDDDEDGEAAAATKVEGDAPAADDAGESATEPGDGEVAGVDDADSDTDSEGDEKPA